MRKESGISTTRVFYIPFWVVLIGIGVLFIECLSTPLTPAVHSTAHILSLKFHPSQQDQTSHRDSLFLQRNEGSRLWGIPSLLWGFGKRELLMSSISRHLPDVIHHMGGDGPRVEGAFARPKCRSRHLDFAKVATYPMSGISPPKGEGGISLLQRIPVPIIGITY